MRVLYVTNSMDVGGIETNLVRLTRELVQRDHDVVVAAGRGRLDDELVAAGGRLAPITGRADPVSLVRDARSLRATVTAERPDVVHVFSATAAVATWPAVRLRRRRPAKVGSIMGLHASPEQSDLPVLIRCWLTSLGSDRLIIMAPAIGAMVRRLPIRKGRLAHGSAVGIDLPEPPTQAQRRSLRAELGVADDERMVVTAGRLEPRKSHELFIRAAARVRESRDDVRFFIAGDGELADDLRAEIARRGVSERVRLIGSRGDVPALIGSADVCVRPGVVEGFIGITVLEAQAVGTPVVAFDLADVRIAVEHEVTGLLVPLSDDAALAAAVLRLLDDVELVERMVRAGRTFVERSYSIHAVADWLLALYTDLTRDVAPRGTPRRRQARVRP